MHGRHLTLRGTTWLFQRRVPAHLANRFPPGPIRVTIGAVGKRLAQSAARHLCLEAEDAMRDRAKTAGQATAEDNRRAVQGRLDAWTEAFLPTLAALDFDGETGLPVPAMRQAVSASLDGLVDLCEPDRTGVGALPAPHRAALGRYYRRLVKDEDLAREHLGMPPRDQPAADPVLAKILASMSAMQRQAEATAAEITTMKEANKPKVGPLFSAAADAYHDGMVATRGPQHDELKYIRHRKAVFIAVCGDRPVTDYTAADLQTFMNKARFLAPNQSKQPGYDVAKMAEYIAEAEAAGRQGLSESTLVNNYVAKVKTIIRAGCDGAGVPYTLGGRRVTVPKGVPKPKAKLLVDGDAANRLLGAAVKSGLLVETMLPLVGYLTGRRLGLLAFLRGEDITRHHGVWVVTPRDQVQDKEGRWHVVPFKTGESLKSFVLHELLVKIGFVDWARQRTGFIFTALHGTKDPADMASKRMCRLYDKAAIDRDFYKMFHGLRHARINLDRELAIDPRTTRLQVGHELRDVHESYGGSHMQKRELLQVASVPLPDDIDFSVFDGLDFDGLAAARPRFGRPFKSKP